MNSLVIFEYSIIIDVLRKKAATKDLIESYPKKERIATTVNSKNEI